MLSIKDLKKATPKKLGQSARGSRLLHSSLLVWIAMLLLPGRPVSFKHLMLVVSCESSKQREGLGMIEHMEEGDLWAKCGYAVLNFGYGHWFGSFR